MYRVLVVLLYLSAASAAPQDVNSDITYVKIQPVISDESEIQPTPNRRESKIQNLPLKISPTNVEHYDSSELEPAYNGSDINQSERQSRNDDVTTTNYESAETTELAEASTEKHERITPIQHDPITAQTEKYETQTKRALPPKFHSKLSYFQKPASIDRSIRTNLVEKNEKRKFRSKCRCAKIWNCPKLQISVPRCPNEYYMCCF